MTKRRLGRRRGTLHLIGGLMVASALIRMSSTGVAFAESAVTAPESQPAGAPMQVATNVTNEATPGTLLAALQAREKQLAEREAQFEDRMQALRVAEFEIEEQLAALVAAEEALKATIALADSAAENDLARLTRVYENMKPKDAAALFEQMTPDFAAGFLGLMDPVAAANIMTLMEPGSAYSISAVLAGRNATVPTQ